MRLIFVLLLMLSACGVEEKLDVRNQIEPAFDTYQDVCCSIHSPELCVDEKTGMQSLNIPDIPDERCETPY